MAPSINAVGCALYGKFKVLSDKLKLAQTNQGTFGEQFSDILRLVTDARTFDPR